MNSSSSSMLKTFATLRKFSGQRKPPVERCELCGLELPPEHDHLVEPQSRRLLCSCIACGLLFSGSTELKYRRVPRDVRRLNDFQLTDSDWDSLMIPINMAFFFFDSSAKKMVAFYPSPAGPVESLLHLDKWHEIIRGHLALNTMQPDVEALLVNRMGSRVGFLTDDYFLAPIDQCYKLVGLLRMHWRGLSGGTEVWKRVREFFDGIRRTAKSDSEDAHV